MAMTSLNISLPEAVKEYVEGQVASGDWGTPSEYVRELIRQDKERRLVGLEQELVAAHRGAKIEISIDEIRKKAWFAPFGGGQKGEQGPGYFLRSGRNLIF